MDIRTIALYQIKHFFDKRSKEKKILSNSLCTFKNPDLFFSYRRDKQTGRFASLIFKNNTWLKYPLGSKVLETSAFSLKKKINF